MRIDNYNELMHESFKALINKSFEAIEGRLLSESQNLFLSDKQIFFIRNMMWGLEALFSKAKGIVGESSLQNAFSSVTKGGIRAFILWLCDRENTSVQAVNAALTAAEAGAKISELIENQKKEAKILRFFGRGNQEDLVFDEKFAAHLVFSLCLEFRLHIEFMKKEEKGCGVLFEFFLNKIRSLLISSSLDFDENERDKRLEFIRGEILNCEANDFPKNPIATDGTGNHPFGFFDNNDKDLKWNLRSLLSCSPIVLIESLNCGKTPSPVCLMSLYRRANQERDGSYKYPARFIMKAQHVAEMPKYKRVPDFRVGMGLDIGSHQNLDVEEIKEDEVNAFSRKYIEMLANLRKKNTRESVSNFNELVEVLSGKKRNTSFQSWVFKISDLISLYNFYDARLSGMVESLRDMGLVQSARASAEACLSTFKINGEILNLRQRQLIIDAGYLKSIEESGLQKTKPDNFDKKHLAPSSLTLNPNCIFELPEDETKYLLTSKEIQKLTKKIFCRDTNGLGYNWNVLEDDECVTYNSSLRRYFQLRKSSELKEAHDAISQAMIPFAICLNDIAAFNHCDVLLIDRIIDISDFLIQEWKKSFKAFPKGTQHDEKNYHAKAMVCRALRETSSIFKNCKRVTAKEVSLASELFEDFKALPTKTKIAFGVGACVGVLGVAGGLATYPKTTAALLIVGGGIAVLGIWYVGIDWYSQTIVKRRIYVGLAEKLGIDSRLCRYFPIPDFLEAEVKKYVCYSQALQKEVDALASKNVIIEKDYVPASPKK